MSTELEQALAKVEELSAKNADLLEAKRKANAEAKVYRENQDAFRDATGIDIGKLKDTFGKLKTGELTPEELAADQKATLEKLRPALIDADSILGKTPAKPPAGSPKTPNTTTPSDKPQEAASGNEELEKLKAENKRLKLSHEFLAQGASSTAVDKLLKLWEEPQITEGQDAQTVRAEALAAFKADNAWGFAQDAQATPATPQSKPPVTPPQVGAIAGNANKQTALEQQIADAEKRNDVEALIRLGHEQKALLGGR